MEEVKKKLRVGILTTSFPAFKGHIQSPFIYELAKALRKKVEVKVICPLYPQSKSEEEWEGIKIKRFKDPKKITLGGGIPSNLKASFFSKVMQLFSFLQSFKHKAKEECYNCNILHAQWILSAFVGALVKNKKQSLILTTRGADLNLALKNPFLKQVLKWTLNKCDYIIPNNESHKKLLLAFGIPENKLTLIPNGLDIVKFKPRNKISARKKLGLEINKKFILFVGWLIPRKGCEYLIKSISEIIKTDKNIKLLIIGEGLLKQKLKVFVEDLGLNDYIDFKGSISPDMIPFWMNASDIFVLPSLSEGKPNVVGEAMASGLPVIATNVDGTPDFIDNGKDSFLIPPKDVDSLTNKLKLLLDNSDLRAKIGKETRKSILKKGLSWERCAEDYLDVYQRVLSKKTQ